MSSIDKVRQKYEDLGQVLLLVESSSKDKMALYDVLGSFQKAVTDLIEESTLFFDELVEEMIKEAN